MNTHKCGSQERVPDTGKMERPFSFLSFSVSPQITKTNNIFLGHSRQSLGYEKCLVIDYLIVYLERWHIHVHNLTNDLRAVAMLAL